MAAMPNNTASIFAQAVAAAELSDAVLNVSSFTLLIPTDAVRPFSRCTCHTPHHLQPR